MLTFGNVTLQGECVVEWYLFGWPVMSIVVGILYCDVVPVCLQRVDINLYQQDRKFDVDWFIFIPPPNLSRWDMAWVATFLFTTSSRQ